MRRRGEKSFLLHFKIALFYFLSEIHYQQIIDIVNPIYLNSYNETSQIDVETASFYRKMNFLFCFRFWLKIDWRKKWPDYCLATIFDWINWIGCQRIKKNESILWAIKVVKVIGRIDWNRAILKWTLWFIECATSIYIMIVWTNYTKWAETIMKIWMCAGFTSSQKCCSEKMCCVKRMGAKRESEREWNWFIWALRTHSPLTLSN